MIGSYEQMSVATYEVLAHAVAEGAEDVALVAILAGMSEEELMRMPLTEYRKLRDIASFLFIEPLPRSAAKHYKIGPFTCGYCTEERKLTTAQYIDFKELVSRGSTMAQLLSVFLVPEGHEYGEGYDVAELQQAISENLCVLDAFALQAVFMDRLGRLTRSTLTSLVKMACKMEGVTMKQRLFLRKRLRLARRSLKNGAGCVRLMQSRSLPVRLGLRFTDSLLQSSSR